MAFRVLIAGFCMERVMNNSMSSLCLMRVPTVSRRHEEEASMAGSSWKPSLFIHLYVFVCVMDYLCNCLILGGNTKNLSSLVDLVNPFLCAYFIYFFLENAS